MSGFISEVGIQDLYTKIHRYNQEYYAYNSCLPSILLLFLDIHTSSNSTTNLGQKRKIRRQTRNRPPIRLVGERRPNALPRW